MITKAEYENSRLIDVAPYLTKIEQNIKGGNFHNSNSSNLGYIPRDQRDRLKMEISEVMKAAGWEVVFEDADSRDGCEDLYVWVT